MAGGERLCVEVLGPIRVVDVDGRDGTPAGTLQRRLLALLVLRRGRVVSVDAAVEVLWPSELPADPVAALQNHLFRLRGALPMACVTELLDAVRPDTIPTFGPDGITFHADHIAVHRWVTRAWEDRGRPARLLYAAPTVEHLDEFGELYEQWDMYMTDERPVGVPADRLAVHVRLGGWELDRKLTALRAMATQTSSLIAVLGPEVYAGQVAEESFVDARSQRPSPSTPLTSVG